MKKGFALLSSVVAASTVLALGSTAFAATKTTLTTGRKANQSVLTQVDNLQKQLKREHRTVLQLKVENELTLYQADLKKEQVARQKIETEISDYEKAVREYKGHDHGIIVKTLPTVTTLVNTVKKELETDQSLIDRDIQTVKVDISKNRLQVAYSDLKKAEARVNQLTNEFNSAAKRECKMNCVNSPDSSLGVYMGSEAKWKLRDSSFLRTRYVNTFVRASSRT